MLATSGAFTAVRGQRGRGHGPGDGTAVLVDLVLCRKMADAREAEI